MNHYTWIIDLLEFLGYFEEALKFIIKIPIKPKSGAWICLLGVHKLNKNIGIGEVFHMNKMGFLKRNLGC